MKGFRRAALKVRSDMAASETGSAALTGPLPGSSSTVSVLVAVAIVVADMIGVGVFTSLGFQVKDIPSGFSILLLPGASVAQNFRKPLALTPGLERSVEK